MQEAGNGPQASVGAGMFVYRRDDEPNKTSLESQISFKRASSLRESVRAFGDSDKQ